MKLVNIAKTGDTYEVKALDPVKIFGIQILATVNTYKLSDDHSFWYKVNSRKKVSGKKMLRLNKWLKDHQKFIEKK